MSVSSFFGIDIMRRAIATQRTALDTTGHNVANANTPGYSRQRVIMSTTPAFPEPSLNRAFITGQIGTGVQVDEVKRIRETFLDFQFRSENKGFGYWEAKASALEKIERILNEPSDDGLQKVMDLFWESWQDLSKNPENLSTRSVVRQRGIAVAETFAYLAKRLDDLEQDLNTEITIKVNQINDYAEQIAKLNGQIQRAEVSGDNANDLRDNRDKLVDELSKLVDVNVREMSDGMLIVMAGNGTLVHGHRSVRLTTQDATDAAGKALAEVYWETGQEARFQSGSLLGTLEARGTIVGAGKDTVIGSGQYEWHADRAHVKNVGRLAPVGTYTVNAIGSMAVGNSQYTATLGGFTGLASPVSGVFMEINGYRIDIDKDDYDIIPGPPDTYNLNLTRLEEKINSIQKLTGVTVSIAGGNMTFTATKEGAIAISLQSVPLTGGPNITPVAFTPGADATGIVFNPPPGVTLQPGEQIIGVPSYPGSGNLVDVGLDKNGDGVIDDFYMQVQLQLDPADPATALNAGDTITISKRDGLIADMRRKLEVLALTFAKEVNEAHKQGIDMRYIKDPANLNKYYNAAGTVPYEPVSFFVDLTNNNSDPLSLDGMVINPLIQFNLDYITAAGPGDPLSGPAIVAAGDNKNALNLVNLRYKRVTGLPEQSTMDDYYRGVISQLGVDAEQSSRMEESQNRLTTSIENQRLSVSGVSLDEEMANMIQFQHAYNSAARMMTTMDEMLDKIINGMGVVGR